MRDGAIRDADRDRLIAPGAPASGAWRIASVHRPDPVAFAGAGDFRPGEETSFEGGSLYAIDPMAGSATLVDVPYAALLGAPFAYAAQAERAGSMATVPLDHLPRSERPVIGLFSIGRCGSTLLGRILAAAGAQVLSEIDAFTPLGPLSRRWPADWQVQDRLRDIAAGCLGHVAGHTPEGPLVLKFRSQSTQAARALVAAGVRPVLLTRDFDGWAASNARAFPHDPLEGRIDAMARGLSDLAALPQPPARLTYEGMLADPVGAAETVLGPVDPGRHAAIRAALGTHSQAGTALESPAGKATPEHITRARTLRDRHTDRGALARLGLGPDLTPITEA